MSLDARIVELAVKYRPLAEEILREIIRIPADHVDRPAEEGGDPLCGLSNHEGPRVEHLLERIRGIGAVADPAQGLARRALPGMDPRHAGAEGATERRGGR